ncbi:MAG: hypothetical protein ACI81L_002685 [Verrucomicrobiales bacterium]|jgi:hypothetical protein
MEVKVGIEQVTQCSVVLFVRNQQVGIAELSP